MRFLWVKVKTSFFCFGVCFSIFLNIFALILPENINDGKKTAFDNKYMVKYF